jgi:hypothetical protein
VHGGFGGPCIGGRIIDLKCVHFINVTTANLAPDNVKLSRDARCHNMATGGWHGGLRDPHSALREHLVTARDEKQAKNRSESEYDGLHVRSDKAPEKMRG